MRPTALFRGLSFKSPAAPVAPWPPARTAFDRWLTAEIEDLRRRPDRYASATWLTKALAVAAQTAAAAAAPATCRPVSGATMDGHLDDIVDLLDACAAVRDRIAAVRLYTNSLAAATHALEGSHVPSAAAVARARSMLGACEAFEKVRTAELDGRLLSRLRKRLTCADSPEINEALDGSRATAALAVGMVGAGLCFGCRRRGIPAVGSCETKSWARALHVLQREADEEAEKQRRGGVAAAAVMSEMESAAAAARVLRDLIGRRRCDRRVVIGGGELKSAVDELRVRCGELEEGVMVVEERVDELYRRLMSVRVSLLGMISGAR